MSKKEKEKNKTSEGIKKFFRFKGGSSCCKLIIEEEKIENEAKPTEKK
jgi:hypothetical protein